MAALTPGKKRYRRIILPTVIVLLPFAVLIGVLVYTKISGFKHALQELVDTKTHGEYELTIGMTEVHIRALSFKFDNIHIDRNPWVVDNGVRSVKIPSFELQFGSFSSLFTEEFSIKRLVVDEPEIELQAGLRKKDSASGKVLISQHIIDIYNAIESVLNRFNIESLSINRASLNIEQDKHQLKISLIDLLIEHWRMRDLSAQSQLKLSIEKQNLSLGNANMSFAGIEYNFLKHHLVFTDFHISSADSISGSDIDVSGESLLLRNLNFKDFANNLKYTLERAEITKPTIVARLKVKKGRKKEVDMGMAVRIMKQTIGQCSVDSIIIRDARVLVELQKEKDTVKIDLPDVDFRLHTFAILQDSSDIQLGEVEVNLNGSELTLSRSLSIKLDEVLYDRHHDLTLRNLTLFSPGAHLPIATLTSMKVHQFNLPSLILFNQFNARSIMAEGGTMNIGAYTHTSQSKDTTFHLTELLIHTVNLKDIAVNYVNGKQRLGVEDLSLWATNVRMEAKGEMKYVIKSIHAKTINYHQPQLKLASQLEDISFNGQALRMAKASVVKDSLTILLEDIDAETMHDLSQGFNEWRSLEIGSANITGKLPVVQPQQSARPRQRATLLGHLMIESLGVSVRDDKGGLTLLGNNIDIENVRMDESLSMPERITGQLQAVAFHSKDLSTESTDIMLKYPEEIIVGDLKINAGRQGVAARSVRIHTISHTDDNWSFHDVFGSGLVITRRQHDFIRSDSLRVRGLKLSASSDPNIEFAEIFNPKIKIVKQEKEHRDSPPREHHRRYIPQILMIHPGELEMSNGQKIYFGTWVANKSKGTLKVSSLHTSFKKIDIVAKNITILDNEVSMDSLFMNSNKSWYTSNLIEESQIDGSFQNLAIKGLSVNKFLRTNKAKGLDIEMGHMALNVYRDKRQTDPPIISKPSTLDGMLKFPDNIGVTHIGIRDGIIEYRQVSDKTGEEGFITLNNLSADATIDSVTSFTSLKAKTSLYNSGSLALDYKTVDATRFKLKIDLRDVDLTKLNQIVMPLQALRIKSGFLKEYTMTIEADEEKAFGNAMISYKGLHLEIFKHNEPERKNLGSEVLTLLADGIILKHTKEDAQSDVTHLRVKHKSVFHYWVTSSIQGAVNTIRKGKRKKL